MAHLLPKVPGTPKCFALAPGCVGFALLILPWTGIGESREAVDAGLMGALEELTADATVSAEAVAIPHRTCQDLTLTGDLSGASPGADLR